MIINNFRNSLDTLINKKLFGLTELLILNYSLLILLASCSVSKQIAKQADAILLKDSAASTGFIGISIYEPATGKYWYNYNATKYFTPASNTKLFTLYAGMKYLGDSLPGLRYTIIHDTLLALPTGDPSFLNPEFPYQPVITLLNQNHLPTIFSNENWKDEKYGPGWAWDDYNDDYMAERNALPVNANLAKIIFSKNDDHIGAGIYPTFLDRGAYLKRNFYFESNRKAVLIKRNLTENIFDIYYGKGKQYYNTQIPLVTNRILTTLEILHILYPWISKSDSVFSIQRSTFNLVRSIPTDSLFAPMMHRSDNFFAEQTLLMVSNERLGYMNDEAIIDTLLGSDLKDAPQKPKWVDGSGLSRYNLFTPQAFIYILNKLKNEFGWARLQHILPTGGQGTLNSYYLKDSGFIYAKTGTLSNNCALSGFLTTNSGKLLIFSILANHYQTGASPIRKATERFLEEIRKKY